MSESSSASFFADVKTESFSSSDQSHFSFFSQTSADVKTSAAVKSSAAVKKALYQCGACNKILFTRSGFRNHLQRTHARENMHQCDKCDKSYKHASGLIQHVRNVHGKVLIKCKKCQKECNNRGNLKRHVRTHFRKAEEEFNKFWMDNYVHTEKQAKAFERLQQRAELQTTSESDASQSLPTPLMYKASTVDELQTAKLPRNVHLRLGSTILRSLTRFREGKLFPLSSADSLEPPSIADPEKYCEMCMKMVPDMATHLRIHQIALAELERFRILPEPYTSRF